MSKGKLQAILLIVVFLLIVAVICSWLTGRNSSSNTASSDTSSAAVTTAASGDTTLPTYSPTIETYTPIINTVAPVVTVSPVPGATGNITVETTTTPSSSDAAAEASPDPDAEATPEPTPTPVPTPEANWNKVTLAQGTFTSKTGTNLNIAADWVAQTSGSQTVDITVTVYATSYSLYTRQFSNAIYYSFGTMKGSSSASAIDYNGSKGLIRNELGSYTFTVVQSAGQSVTQDLDVQWHYNGSYGGTALGTIQCGGSITVTRSR